MGHLILVCENSNNLVNNLPISTRCLQMYHHDRGTTPTNVTITPILHFMGIAQGNTMYIKNLY